MCTGGRIINHLKRGIEDPKNDIVFVSSQAEGTVGSDIISNSKKPGGTIMLDGQDYRISARVHVLSGYSGLADQRELSEWVGSMPKKPGTIKLVHASRAARQALASHLRYAGYSVLE